MVWVVNIGFFLVLTCLTGSICMAVWLASMPILQKHGSSRAIYRLLKLVMWGHTVPLLYLVFSGRNWFMTSEGWVLFPTPVVELALCIGFLLWVAGAVGYTVYQLPMVRHFQCIRKSRMYAPVAMTAVLGRLKKEMGIRKNIILYQGYAVTSPFICGFRRTEIYLPARDLSRRELEITLRHELTHHKQRDTFWKPAFAVINGLFWFNPLAWRIARQTEKWAEASCDEACCQNGLTAKEYFGIITDMIPSETKRPGAYSPLWAEGNEELLWRIHCSDRIPEGKSGRPWVAVAAAAVIMAGSFLSVYVTTIGASMLYNMLFRSTRDQAKESALNKEVIEKTGTADELFEGLTVEEDPDAKTHLTNWTIKDICVKTTASFNRKNGESIEVAGVIEPKDIAIQLGIIEPDNHLRYIDVKASFSHTFKLTKEGSYKVYIQNLNTTTANSRGAYH